MYLFLQIRIISENLKRTVIYSPEQDCQSQDNVTKV